ncbi:hypothetical protein RI054_16g75700 [Pseudoscourfieldia marina]
MSALESSQNMDGYALTRKACCEQDTKTALADSSLVFRCRPLTLSYESTAPKRYEKAFQTKNPKPSNKRVTIDTMCSRLKSYQNRTAHRSFTWISRQRTKSAVQRIDKSYAPGLLCIAGGSHASYLCRHIRQFYKTQCVHLLSRFADEPTKDERCSYVLIHKGQWDLGFVSRLVKGNDDGPTPLRSYHENLSRQISRILSYRSNRTLGILSSNFIPLSATVNACPPKDWRNPFSIFAYNSVHENLSRQFGIKYVDNTNVILPLWDASPDWNHPKDNVLDALSREILIRLDELGWNLIKVKRKKKEKKRKNRQ